MSVDKDLVSVQQARDLVEAAHRTQVELARFDQARLIASARLWRRPLCASLRA